MQSVNHSIYMLRFNTTFVADNYID